MKKNVRSMIILAVILVFTMTSAALADTIVSPVFQFSGVQAAPTATPEPEAEAAGEGETADAAEEPTEVQQPEADPEPDVKLSVSSNLAGGSVVMEGTELVLTLTVEGAEGYAYTIQWQQSSDGGATWTDVAGATGAQYRLKLKPAHTGMYWRATIDLGEPVTEE